MEGLLGFEVDISPLALVLPAGSHSGYISHLPHLVKKCQPHGNRKGTPLFPPCHQHNVAQHCPQRVGQCPLVT